MVSCTKRLNQRLVLVSLILTGLETMMIVGLPQAIFFKLVEQLLAGEVESRHA